MTDVRKAIAAERRRSLLIYGSIVAALLACAVASGWQARAVVQDVRLQNQASALVVQTSTLLSSVELAETGQRGFLLTDDELYLASYERGRKQALVSLQALLTSLGPQQQAALAQISSDVKAKLDELELTIAIARRGEHEEAVRVVRTNAGKELMDRIRLGVARVAAHCEAARVAGLEDEAFRVELTGYAFGGLLLAVVALVVFALTIQKKAFAGVVRGTVRMSRAAYRDALTGLPNRRELERRLGALEGSRSDVEDAITALFIDLDGFKAINDTLGHASGDLLLRRVSALLRNVTRCGDTLARVGGDEFVLIAPGLVNRHEIDQLCSRLLAAVHSLAEEFASVGLSIGIATREAKGETLGGVLKRADVAMYEAKRSGGGYRFSHLGHEPSFA